MTDNFAQVQPPAAPPHYEASSALGIISCLKVSDYGEQFRCCKCHQMSPGGPCVWVPDDIEIGDPEWSIAETCRKSAYNGRSSLWCMDCARKLTAKPDRDWNWICIVLIMPAAVLAAVLVVSNLFSLLHR